MTTNPAASIAKGIEPYNYKDPNRRSLVPDMITGERVVEALHKAGFPESEWVTGVAIARRESSFVPNLIGAVNYDTRGYDPENASWDFGLFQISFKWNARLMKGDDKLGEWDNPDDNARMAKFLFDESVRRGHEGWRPWHTYTSGNYRVYLDLATEAVEAYKRSETYSAITPTRPEDAVIQGRYEHLVIETQEQVGIAVPAATPTDTSTGVVIHHPGADALALGPHQGCRYQVKMWDHQHRNQGWVGIGYNLMLCHHGILMLGRGLNRQGAHAPGANSTHVGLLIMTANGKRMTPNQLRGLLDTLTWLRHEGVNVDNVTPHSDWVATSCPGDEHRRDIRDGVWRTESPEEDVVSDDKLVVDGVLGSRTISELQRALNEGRF